MGQIQAVAQAIEAAAKIKEAERQRALTRGASAHVLGEVLERLYSSYLTIGRV